MYMSTEQRGSRSSSSQPNRENDVFAATDVSSSSMWSGQSSTGCSWTIYHGKAVEILKQLPRSSVDCIITSPPYFWLRDYGIDGQIGQEGTVEEYIDSLSNVMSELRDLLRPEGLLFLNMGDTYYSGKGESQGKDRKARNGDLA